MPASRVSHQISRRQERIIITRDEGKCQFPGCGKRLITCEPLGDDSYAIAYSGEFAHLRSPRLRGPRYDPAFPKAWLNMERNVVFMCQLHHKLVDDYPALFPVEMMENWIIYKVERRGASKYWPHFFGQARTIHPAAAVA